MTNGRRERHEHHIPDRSKRQQFSLPLLLFTPPSRPPAGAFSGFVSYLGILINLKGGMVELRGAPQFGDFNRLRWQTFDSGSTDTQGVFHDWQTASPDCRSSPDDAAFPELYA
jgi:hypothetical protein